MRRWEFDIERLFCFVDVWLGMIFTEWALYRYCSEGMDFILKISRTHLRVWTPVCIWFLQVMDSNCDVCKFSVKESRRCFANSPEIFSRFTYIFRDRIVML